MFIELVKLFEKMYIENSCLNIKMYFIWISKIRKDIVFWRLKF